MAKKALLIVVLSLVLVATVGAQGMEPQPLFAGSCAFLPVTGDDGSVVYPEPHTDPNDSRYIGGLSLNDPCVGYINRSVVKFYDPVIEQGNTVLSPNGMKIAYNNFQNVADDTEAQVWVRNLLTQEVKQIIDCDRGCIVIEWADRDHVVVERQDASEYLSVDVNTLVSVAIAPPPYNPVLASPYNSESFVRLGEVETLILAGQEVLLAPNGDNVQLGQTIGEGPLFILSLPIWLPDGNVVILFSPSVHDRYVYLYQVNLDGTVAPFGPSNIGWRSINPWYFQETTE